MSANYDSVKVAKSRSIVDWQLVERGVWHTREVISDDVFGTLFISNFEIKLLKGEEPTDESGLHVLLEHKVSKCEMVGEYCGFGPK